MNETAALIERERKKLAWLRDKVADQERRVKALEQLTPDALDEMFERESSATTQESAPIASVEPVAEPARPPLIVTTALPKNLAWITPNGTGGFRVPRSMSPSWMKMFEFIGTDGKTLRSIEAFIASGAVSMTPGAARAGLMNYRKEFGLITSSRKGFYQVTERGIALMKALKNESPAFHGAFKSQTT